MNSTASEHNTARYLLWVYCVFIIYGCFIPFHFNFDPNFVRWRWSIFVTELLEEKVSYDALRGSVREHYRVRPNCGTRKGSVNA